MKNPDISDFYFEFYIRWKMLKNVMGLCKYKKSCSKISPQVKDPRPRSAGQARPRGEWANRRRSSHAMA